MTVSSPSKTGAKIRFSVRRVKEIDSTNTRVQKLASEGAAEGLVLVTDYQTGGRGKPGRSWVSPRGKNLLFSVLLRPPVAPSRAPMITQIACRAIAAVLENDYGIESTFKRPNDIMIRGRKICGVLTEASSSRHQVESVVVGVGLNVNAEEKELVPTAISMKKLLGRRLDPKKLLRRILAQLAKDLAPFYDRTA